MPRSPDLPLAAAEPRQPAPRIVRLNPRAERIERRITLVTVILPFLGVLAAIALLWGRGVGWLDLGLLAVMYTLTAVGVGAGYHRLLAHRAFKTTPWLRTMFTILGSMAGQGPVLFWTAVHRRHHAHSDEAGDPHSPHLHGPGRWAFLRGLWHAHTGWLFDHESANVAFYVPDLLKDQAMYRLNQAYFLWMAVGLAAPAVAGGLLTQSWTGALTGFIWGGWVRMCLLHHATWSINSICHVYGRRPYQTGDLSANNPWLALPSFGEAWHNNHHAYPSSAMHGLEWWQVDLCGLLIRFLRATGLAWDVRSPRADAPGSSPMALR